MKLILVLESLLSGKLEYLQFTVLNPQLISAIVFCFQK